MAEPLSEDEAHRIYLKGIEYYNHKEYIKAVLEWDRIIDLTGKVDYRLKSLLSAGLQQGLFKAETAQERHGLLRKFTIRRGHRNIQECA